MKIKNIKITIKDRKQVLDEFAKTWHLMKEGKAQYGHDEISFQNINAFRNAFTEKRMEVLHTIKEENPRSIYDLAKKLRRDFKNVSCDVHFLQALGLISLEKQHDARNRVKPMIDFEMLRLDIKI